MNVFCIDLQAVDPSHNRRRFYRIEAGQDLLGAWVIRLQYGRIGTQGRIRDVAVVDEHEGRCIVRACLARRRSAPRRIGVPYQVQELFDPLHWTTQDSAA